MGIPNGKVQGRTSSGMAGSRGSKHTLESWLCLSSASFCVGLLLRQVHATSTASRGEGESPAAPRMALLSLCHFLAK